MAGKQADEAKLAAAFKMNPRNKGAGSPWARIAETVKVQKDIYLPFTYIEKNRGFNTDLAYFARWIVRVTEEKTKPNEKRLRRVP